VPYPVIGANFSNGGSSRIPAGQCTQSSSSKGEPVAGARHAHPDQVTQDAHINAKAGKTTGVTKKGPLWAEQEEPTSPSSLL
jgi:hypothetical protein